MLTPTDTASANEDEAQVPIYRVVARRLKLYSPAQKAPQQLKSEPQRLRVA